MRIGVINIPRKVGVEAWRQCFRLAAARCDVFGVNENHGPTQAKVYLQMAKTLHLGQWGTRTGPNPVFWVRALYKLVQGEQVQLHERGPWYARWPGFNEERYATIVELEHREHPDEPNVVVICTHLVPEGRKVPAWWRTAARAKSFLGLRHLIRQYRRQGAHVYLIGDMNIAIAFRVILAFRWVRPEGIDKVGVAPARGWRLQDSSFKLFKAPTDHKHGVAALVTLRRKRRAGKP